MANEARVNASMTIKKGNVNYSSLPQNFQVDVSGEKGPAPGAFLASTEGTDVDLSELTVPGLCRLQNLDHDNFVTFGIWDGATFYPLLELLPGETYVMRLSRSLGQEYGTGTGTSGPAINTLRVKADTDDCNVVVEAFEA